MPPTAAATQVAELVRALALGWKNLAAYPPGHPALGSSLQLVQRRLSELRAGAGEVTLGIENDGLRYANEKIESTTAQKFAQALFMRGVAVLRFAPDTNAQDIEVFLRLLASPADDGRAIWEELGAAGVTRIELQPVDYSQVRVTDDLEAPPDEKQPSLWEEILRALMEGHELSAEAKAFLVKEGQTVTELVHLIVQHIDETSEKPAFDPDATFGIRMPLQDAKASAHARIADAVGNYVSRSKGPKRENALHQAIDLLRNLPQPIRSTVLRKITETLATDDAAAPQLRQLAEELPPAEVLEALRHVSTLTKLSPHALALLQSLIAMEASTQAEPPTESLIADLVRIFGEDDVDRFNPPDHAALLEQVSIHVPHVPGAVAPADVLGKRTETVANPALERQLGRTLLELLPVVGVVLPPRTILSRIETLFRSHLTNGDVDDAFELTQKLNDVASATHNDELRHAIHESIGNLTARDMIRALVDSLQNMPPEKARVLQRLTETLGSGARRNLLIALSEESNRSRRRKLFDFITSLGPVIAPEATSFLSDDRWYVLRNMIVMLRSVNDRTSLPELRKLAHHRDLRVRMEAIKSLFALDTSVPTELLENLINDPDPKVSETAVSLIGTAGIREAVKPLLRIVEGNDIFGARRSLRIKAIRALGDLGDPASLPELQRFLRDSILPWPNKDERLAAWESLSGYPPDVRRDIVSRGAQSRDPQVREICERMIR